MGENLLGRARASVFGNTSSTPSFTPRGRSGDFGEGKPNAGEREKNTNLNTRRFHEYTQVRKIIGARRDWREISY